ncbi:MAG: permease-like cell division protein FtsX [Saccharofermentans sp.]|nr:permease-like cell division protein FtsX [Saccharofermentans sp.]
MSLRAFFNSVKEGIRGIIRHPLVTIASITTILLMLIIMGVFFIFSVNARAMMTKLSQKPPIEIYMKLQCTQEQLDLVDQALANNPAVIEYIRKSPEENYNDFKANLGSSASLLDNFDYNMYLPHTFSIRLSDPALAQSVCDSLSTLDGVSKVSQESRVMNLLTRASRIVNITTLVAFVVLFLISLFIISNMVRISVYSRANEIEIMKFVGATNNYIRLPYITEGAIVGIISAVCAWLMTALIYRQVYRNMMEQISQGSFYALIPTRSFMWQELIILVLMGVIIGAVGSGISVRKYVRV